MNEGKIIFAEQGDESIKIDDENVGGVLHELEDLAATDLLVVKDLTILDVDPTQPAADCEQHTVLVDNHRVVARVPVPDCSKGWLYLRGVNFDLVSGGFLLHLFVYTHSQ
jgi:hypothetical protein